MSPTHAPLPCAADGGCLLTLFFLPPTRRTGSPSYPSKAQIEAMKAASKTTDEPLTLHTSGETTTFSVSLLPNSGAMVLIK